MPSGVVNLNFFILGLLARKPVSGYDIKRFMKSLGWPIGSPGGGSLYPVLRDLLQEDLVPVEVIPGLDRLPRKIYSITEPGRQALQSRMRISIASVLCPAGTYERTWGWNDCGSVKPSPRCCLSLRVILWAPS